MTRFVLIKSGRALFTLFLVTTICFLVLRLTGDPLDALLSEEVPETIRQEYRVRLGLDRPLAEQYGRFVLTLAQGDFGTSLVDGRSALSVVLERVPATLELGLAVLLTGLAIGASAGVASALNRGSALDRFIMSGAVFGYAMPGFFLGILLILVFSLQLRWLPSSGYGTWAHLIMPAITLGSSMAGKLARFVRTSVLDVLGQPFIQAAYGMRLPPLHVLGRHIFPNAAIPVVTFLGFEIGTLIGGAVVAETVFGWPGIGRLLAVSVAKRDLAVVQCIIVLIATTMIVANLLVDLAYGWLDPRVRNNSGARQ